jgi:hypothetical protein
MLTRASRPAVLWGFAGASDASGAVTVVKLLSRVSQSTRANSGLALDLLASFFAGKLAKRC